MLEARDLSVFYGRHRALEKVSVRVEQGEICVILGANGAGKSTLLKVIAGLIRCEAGGTVSVRGTDITSMKPSRIVEHGIALVPEGGAIFGELTVAENLLLGGYPDRARGNEEANRRRVYELFPVLAKRRGQVARTMSGGEQKMLAIGRALMSSPEVLLLDEPSLGLSPLLTTELFKTLKAIGESGTGILLVEQNANQSLKIADRGYLLENGHILGEDSAQALASDPAVRHAYLGIDTSAGQPGKETMALPPQPELEEPDAAQIARHAEELAARAAAIQAAHAAGPGRSQSTPGISASGDTAAPRPRAQSTHAFAADAMELTRIAGALAERAAEIDAQHIRSLRRGKTSPSLPAPAPSAPAPGPTAPSRSAASERAPDLSALTRMGEEFARRAAQSSHSFSGERREATAASASEDPDLANSSRASEPASALSASAEELATHAAALQARHVAARRLAGNAASALLNHHREGEHAVMPRSKKHRNGKKKEKKLRKRCGKHKGD